MSLSFNDLVKTVVLVFVLLIALYFLSQITQILLIFALVIILAMMLTAPVSWLERRGVPRWTGSLIIILTLLGILFLFGLLFIPPLIQQTTLLLQKLPEYVRAFQVWFEQVAADYPALAEIAILDEQLVRDLIGRAEMILRQAGQVIMGLAGGIAALILVIVMTIFTLLQPRPLLLGLFSLLPTTHREPVARALLNTARQVRVWVWSSSLIGLIDATLAWIGLTLLGVQPPLLLASLLFFGEFFPYVGPIAASIPALALAFAVSPITPLWVLILYLGIHQLEASFLSPYILSRRMKFHPISIAFALLALGSIYGILGAFLAVPTLAAIKSFFTEMYLNRREIDQVEAERCVDLVVDGNGNSKEKKLPVGEEGRGDG